MKNKIFIFTSTVLLLITFQNFTIPDFPSRNIDTVTVQKIDTKYQPITSHLPMLDYTLDGRIAILRRGGNALYALTPEKVINHLQDPRNPRMGGNLIRGTHDFKYNADAAFGTFKNNIGNQMQASNTLICEKTNLVTNPMVCKDRDCYNVTLVTFYKQNYDQERTLFRIASMDVEFSVINPKTASARIDPSSFIVNPRSFKVGPPILANLLAEPVIAGDGRLLITRFGFRPASILNGPALTTGNINIVYSTYAENRSPCDPSQWTQFHPISHAHYDHANKMPARYKFARYPLRDSLGNIIPNGKELGASYPWMDKGAANLFFTSFGGDSFYNFKDGQVITPFPEKNSSDYFTLLGMDQEDFLFYKPALEGDLGPIVGFTFAGFWTHGKMVVLDGQINNADYGFRVSDRRASDGTIINTRRELRLYKRTPASQIYEPAGAVRELGSNETSNSLGTIMSSDYHHQLSKNTTFIGSLENRLNYNSNVFPVTPRDIVWHFGSTRHTEEVIFDDYNSPYFLINAEMTAPVTKQHGHGFRLHHYTGFKDGTPQSPVLSGFPRTLTSFPPLIQNTATAPDDFMRVPYYGKILGTSRIEPLSKGGIHGKGLWLENKNAVAFNIPLQTNTSFNLAQNEEWYAGVFIDPRGPVDMQKHYALFSLGKIQIALTKTQSGVHLYDQISFLEGASVIARKNIPPGLFLNNNRWRHISLVISKKTLPQLYLDGFSIGVLSLEEVRRKNFLHKISIQPQQILFLGSHQTGQLLSVKGWYDEFKVRATIPTEEEICNYSRGTLVAVSPQRSQGPHLYDDSRRYPLASHKNIRSLIAEENTSKFYACATKYYGSTQPLQRMVSDNHMHLKQLPKGSTPLREKILGLKNMLVFDQPRPDFSSNKFCLSCHVSQNPHHELNITALRKFPTSLQYDARRQPMQPPAKLQGHIPANYFGNGMPSHTVASNSPQYVDQYMHPARTSIDIKWNALADHVYSLAVMNSATNAVLGACVNAGRIKNATEYRFDGVCISRSPTSTVPLTHETKVRICAAPKQQWGTENTKCSNYVPLNYHENGELWLRIQP